MKCIQGLNHAIFAVVVALGISACDKEPISAPAPADISRPAIILSLQPLGVSPTYFTGIVRSAQRAELAFKKSGKLATLVAQEGDHVKRDQLLATLDDAELITALDSAKVQSRQAQIDFDRGSKIFSTSQAISRSDLDQLKVQRDLAANKVSQAQQDLDNVSLKAPFAGIISQKLVSNFAAVQSNQPIYVIHNPHDLEVMINVPGKLFLKPSGSQQAIAEIEGLTGQRFPLTYRYYAADADPVSQTYQVVLGFDDPNSAPLLPGMAAKVYPVIDAASEAEFIMLPIDAVVPSNTGSQFVWLVGHDSRVTQREIKVGNVLGGQIQVIEGLKADDRIVVAGVHALTQGMKVHSMNAEESN